MAGLSKYLALGLFNSTLNPVRESLVAPTTLYLALHSGAPSDATYGTEADYAGYARRALNSLTADVSAETVDGNVDIVVTNGSAVTFPASTGAAAQLITNWAIWDSAVRGDGNILYSGVLSSARLIGTGDSVVVPEGSLVITIK